MLPADRAVPVPEPSPERQNINGTIWPHRLSHEASMRVSDVLALIQPEFPALTPSKLRFLDSEGLVVPFRTGSGYRQYSPADVERLRYVLRQQRDHYRPLGVIAEQLGRLDRGEDSEPVTPHAVESSRARWVGVDVLAADAGVSPSLVDELAEAGIIASGPDRRFGRELVSIVAAAGAYINGGGDLRALKVLRNSAVRQADLASQQAAPLRAAGKQEAARDAARDLSEAAIEVFSAVIRRELETDE